MFLISILLVILLFGVTVFVHELGHYLFAKWLGLVVDVFSIGFGPAIVKKKIGDVTYKIGCIPVGGYVALPQLDPGGAEDADGNKRDLPAIAAWKKILVAFAGAFFNVLFAILIAYIVFWGGKSLVHDEQQCVVGYVTTNSLAYEIGIRPGDVILSIDEKPVSRWDQFIIESALNNEVKLEIKRPDGTSVTQTFQTEKMAMGGRLVDGIYKQMPCLIIGVRPGGSAEKAGIKAGDIISLFAGKPIYSVTQLTELVDEYSGKETPVVIIRNGKKELLLVTPEYNKDYERALIGIEFNPFDIYKRPMEQLKGWASPVFRLLKALVTPKEARNAASAVGGPLAIFNMIWMAVRTSFLLALWLTGLLNVNLAIINLLPIPILDGGHIVFAFWEMITRKPVPEKLVNILANIFFVLLISLFLLLTYNDFRRLILPSIKQKFFAEEIVDSESAPDAQEAVTE